LNGTKQIAEPDDFSVIVADFSKDLLQYVAYERQIDANRPGYTKNQLWARQWLKWRVGRGSLSYLGSFGSVTIFLTRHLG
jgi:hypothetical protein